MSYSQFEIPHTLPIDDQMGRVKLQSQLLEDMKFACNLSVEELPLYVNHKAESIRKVVVERLAGKVLNGEPTVESRFYPFLLVNTFVCKF
jgi:hypothetical protein